MRSTGRARGQDELRELGLTPDDVALFNRLAGAVVFTGPALRRAGRRRRQPPGSAGPVAARHLRRPPDRAGPRRAAGDESLVRQLVQWHAYARRRGLDLDLVILDERPGDAAERLKADLQAGPAGPLLGKPGGVFVLAAGTGPGRRRGRCSTAAARAVLGGGPRLAGRATRAADRQPPSSRRRWPRPPLAVPRRARRGPPRRPRASCSGTASAGSRRTAAST